MLTIDWPSEWRSQSWDWLGDKNGNEGESNSSTLRNVGLIIAGFLALIFAYWRSVVADKQAKASDLQANTAERSLLNERYQQGAEMLGSPVLSVRLGGIYALQRLASEYPQRYHLQIMQLLCAFVRNPTDEPSMQAHSVLVSPQPTKRLRDDVQAVMEALGSRSEEGIAIEYEVEYCLDLRGADLSYLMVLDANLSKALFQNANLYWAQFYGEGDQAYLSEANFRSADLTGARIWRVDLRRAIFCGAKLSETSFLDSDLSGSMFSFGYIEGGGAIEPATQLTQEQLDDAVAWPDLPPRLLGLKDSQTGESLTWHGRLPSDR